MYLQNSTHKMLGNLYNNIKSHASRIVRSELEVGCPQDTDAERECLTPSDSILFADSDDVLKFRLRPHLTEKIDF